MNFSFLLFFIRLSSSVRLGAQRINSTNDDFIQDVNIIRSEQHPMYNEKYGINDIALLTLERDIDATRKFSNRSFLIEIFQFVLHFK